MDRRHHPSHGEVPPLLVFVVVLASGAAMLQLARVFLHMGSHVGNVLFVALPIVAVLGASRYVDRT